MDTPSEKQIEKILSENEKKEITRDFGRDNLCAEGFLVNHSGMTLEEALPYFEKCYPISYLLKKLERISSEIDEIKTKGLIALDWERMEGILTAVKIDGDIYEKRKERRLIAYGKHMQDELEQQPLFNKNNNISIGNKEGMKQCNTCKQWKDKTEFYKAMKAKDGLRANCRECGANYYMQWKERRLKKEEAREGLFDMENKGMKQCTKCKQWKDKSEFHKDKKARDGLYCHCKQCSAETQRKRKEKISEKEIDEEPLKNYYRTIKDEEPLKNYGTIAIYPTIKDYIWDRLPTDFKYNDVCIFFKEFYEKKLNRRLNDSSYDVYASRYIKYFKEHDPPIISWDECYFSKDIDKYKMIYK